MFNLKTLTFAVLCLLFMIPGSVPRVGARPLSQGDKYFNHIPAADSVYEKWRDETLGESGPSVPHYALSTVLKRIDEKTAAFSFAAVGRSVEGALLEISPGLITRGAAESPQFYQLIEPISISVHLSKTLAQRLNPMGQGWVVLPAYGSVNGYRIVYSYRRDAAAEKQSMTVLVDLSNDVSSATTGAVYQVD